MKARWREIEMCVRRQTATGALSAPLSRRQLQLRAEISAPLEQVPTVAAKRVLGTAAGFVLLLARPARLTAA